jgi:hypothetical protein
MPGNDPNRKRCVRRSARDDDIFGGRRAISVPPATIGRAPNGGALDAGFSPYQSTRLSRYYAGP